MAAGKKKAKAKPRKKAPAKRPAARRKPAKRPAKAKPAPLGPAALPPPGERIGTVIHYFGNISVAIIKLDAGQLRVGDTIHIRGHTTDFSQRIESLQVDHASVPEVGPRDDFGVKVREHARENDTVYLVR